MSVSGKGYSFVTHYVRKLCGGSQPILAQGDDGLLYVVKFNNNLQGANLPFNESIGAELYRACGLAGPSWKPLIVTDSFLDRNSECWMQTPEGHLRPESGLCFASRFLGGDGIHLLEILPGTSFKQVRNHQDFWLAWLIDICAGHADNRQAIFRVAAESELDAFFFDNGHLFGGPKGELQPHFLASRHLDLRIYQNVSSQHLLTLGRVAGSLDVDQLWKQAQALPEQWKTTSALDGFAQFLSRLSTPTLLQGILETMVDAYERTNGFEPSEFQYRREPRAPILFPGVQAAEFGRCLGATQADFPDRAQG